MDLCRAIVGEDSIDEACCQSLMSRNAKVWLLGKLKTIVAASCLRNSYYLVYELYSCRCPPQTLFDSNSAAVMFDSGSPC